MKLDYKKTIFVGFAFFLISAFWQAYDAIIPLALTNHFGMPQSVSGAVMSLDNILAVFMLPIFGALSDKVNSKYGKRTPFIVIGTVFAIISFILLTVIDNHYISFAAQTNEAIATLREEINLLFEKAAATSDEALKESFNALAESKLAEVTALTYEVTKANVLSFVGFVGVLLAALISMATFRSPAVALMPDVTIKPLRSKGNAIINLMGTAGGIIILVLGMIFKTSKNLFMSYTGYVVSVCAVMLFGLVVFVLTVRENKWANQMLEDTERLKIEDISEEEELSGSRKLSKPELVSLILILASVALWYIGYNSITSKYSVYATNVLGFDYNATLIIAQAAAIVSFIPVGMLASKIGRRRSILIGVSLLTLSFFFASFITAATNPVLMYVVFITAGIGWATINVNSFPMVVELAKAGDVGKYTGYYYTASMAAQIVTPILSGLLIDWLGWKIFFPYAAVFVAASLVTMFFVKHGDSHPAEREDAADGTEGV